MKRTVGHFDWQCSIHASKIFQFLSRELLWPAGPAKLPYQRKGPAGWVSRPHVAMVTRPAWPAKVPAKENPWVYKNFLLDRQFWTLLIISMDDQRRKLWTPVFLNIKGPDMNSSPLKI